MDRHRNNHRLLDKSKTMTESKISRYNRQIRIRYFKVSLSRRIEATTTPTTPTAAAATKKQQQRNKKNGKQSL